MAGGRTGGGWVDARTAQRLEADGRTSGLADESRQGGLAIGRTSGRTRGLKGPAPRSPLHSLAPRLLASLQSEFAGRLGVHWGPSRGYVIFFLLRTTYLQFRHSTMKCVPELFWHYLEL